MKMRNNLILFVLAVIIVVMVVNVRSCERYHVPEVGNKVLVLESEKETIKAKIVIEEKKVTRVKEQQATIKKRLTVAKKGLILEVNAIKDDTSKIKQVIEVINTQGLLISADSSIIALQDTIIGHYKQLDSNNTNIIVELKEDSKKEVKKAKRKGFWNGVKTSIGVAVVIGLAKALSMIF